MKIKFKPMLLSNDEFNLEDLDYTNMYISIKRDGVRAEVTNEGIKNRSLKILRNTKVQAFFKEVCDKLPSNIILDAEIYADGIPCREMAGICNSSDKDVPENTMLYIFGIYDSEATFEERNNMLLRMEGYLPTNKNQIVDQVRIYSSKDAKNLYDIYIKHGFEGAVLMDGNGLYKCGRVTINQHIGFKIKPFKETDLEILGTTERLLNTNESQTNELGRSFKRNTVADKKETGIAACFICKLREIKDDDILSEFDKKYGVITTKVTIIGDEYYRMKIWREKESYIGAYAVVKSMAYGEKSKLRHPRLISIKESVEK